MANVAKKDNTAFSIELNQSEAEWLKSFIQNYPGDPEAEPDECLLNRYELWRALNDAGVKST